MDKPEDHIEKQIAEEEKEAQPTEPQSEDYSYTCALTLMKVDMQTKIATVISDSDVTYLADDKEEAHKLHGMIKEFIKLISQKGV